MEDSHGHDSPSSSAITSLSSKLHPDSCTLLEALSLNDIELATKIVQNPNRKHSGKVCYKEYVPLLIADDDIEDNKTNKSMIITLHDMLVSTKKKTKNTALHIAAFAGEDAFLRTCFEEMRKQKYSKERIKLITNCLNASNDTPMLHAASKGHLTCVNLLCELGYADVRHRNKDGLDALMASCATDTTTTNGTKNTPIMARYLFEKGADIETTDVRGRRALHYAVASENMVAVEFLLNEAKVNAAWKDSFGRTALDECVNSANRSNSNTGGPYSNAVTNPELMEMLRKGMEKSKQVQEELFLKMLEEEEEREEQEKRKKEKKKKKKKKNAQQQQEEEKDGIENQNRDSDDEGEENKEEEEEEEEEEENNDNNRDEKEETTSAWTNTNNTALFEDDSSFEIVTSKKKKQQQQQQQQKVKPHSPRSIPPPLPPVPPPNRSVLAPALTTSSKTNTNMNASSIIGASIMPPWLERARHEFEEKHPASVDLEVTLEHVLGLNLESLSASQLDVVADAHVAALEEVRKHRLRLIQKRIIEQREENTMARANNLNNAL